eukprot:CAMPEP_0180546998 /NCGR_PEP_ID=MMETSP1036_2-20121128/70852_1 /TAXON_ID=632150 /ORGANISM="Azadinium spinosum, Strain 3D9" /LENGTH=83 /DNA_ID=CAMNT_0022562105 /DNA_START=218 /DNA_END=469 /DNA_ORIENTATION=+
MWNQSQEILSTLGPEMAPSNKLGVGTSVAAALMMQMMQTSLLQADGDVAPEFVNLNRMLDRTAETAAKACEPLRELPAFEAAV